jgi:hypothetical protein
MPASGIEHVADNAREFVVGEVLHFAAYVRG